MHASISNWPVQRTQTVASNHDLPRRWPQSLVGRYRGSQLKWRIDLASFCLLSSEPILFPLRDILQVLQVEFIELTGKGSFLSDILI